jgi:hypothetical protein
MMYSDSFLILFSPAHAINVFYIILCTIQLSPESVDFTPDFGKIRARRTDKYG